MRPPKTTKSKKPPEHQDLAEFIDVLESERQDNRMLILEISTDFGSRRRDPADYFSETGSRIRPAKGCE